MRKMWLRGVVSGVALWVAASVCGAQATDAQLLQRLQGMVTAHPGKIALFATQLNTGRTVALDADKPVQTASVIKLAILYEAMEQVREGKARWDEKMTLKPGDAVEGSGMLHFFDAPLTVTLKDVLTMMIIVSDNTATNLAIDRFGLNAVNGRMNSMGLKDTHLYKKVFKPATGLMPADQPKFGLGKTTPREMGTLIQWIGECHLRKGTAPGAASALNFLPMDDADRAVCEVGLGMLKNQFYQETIPRYLKGGDGTTASKTGSLDAVRNDVAIVAGKSGPMVISIFTYDNADHGWTVDNEAEIMIAKLAKAIVETWSPAGLDEKALVPGLGLSAEAAKK